MREQLLLLLRVSKPEYNKTLYENYTLYMNRQMMFNNESLTEGQKDNMEGVISKISHNIAYSIDNRKTWNPLGNVLMEKVDHNAYIYCMYGIKYDANFYNKEQNKYYHLIPWRVIKSLWQGGDTELMIIKNTSVFIDKFCNAAEQANVSYSYGKIRYDLEEKFGDVCYYDSAMRDSFVSVYHKIRKGYETQNEVRFSLLCPNKPDHYELALENDKKLLFDLVPLRYGKHVLIELSNIEFDKKLGLPVRFSPDIRIYESAKNIE